MFWIFIVEYDPVLDDADRISDDGDFVDDADLASDTGSPIPPIQDPGAAHRFQRVVSANIWNTALQNGQYPYMITCCGRLIFTFCSAVNSESWSAAKKFATIQTKLIHIDFLAINWKVKVLVIIWLSFGSSVLISTALALHSMLYRFRFRIPKCCTERPFFKRPYLCQ